MMAKELTCRMKSYIQPFERKLALMELESVARSGVVRQSNSENDAATYKVVTSVSPNHLAELLTYWEAIETKQGGIIYTSQVRREASVNMVRNGSPYSQIQASLPFNIPASPLPNRRVLRYGPHGIHEYRGKFFPQLVRAFLNVANVRRSDIVLDPMCGSGTTPVEASLMGCKACGIDMNPLSVLITQTKCAILRTSPNTLAAEYESFRADIINSRRRGDKLSWFGKLSLKDQAYLRRWFSPQVLTDLDTIAFRIQAVKDSTCRDLFRICLSNILRGVSWQKEDDLRVRKKVSIDTYIDVLGKFSDELERTVRTIIAFLLEEKELKPGPVDISEGDARMLAGKGGPYSRLKGRVKAIVTSPPYATALPYLDTDRLSLCYLGLLSRSHHHARDYEMIGNREVSELRRREYWADYQSNKANLPREVGAIIDKIHRLNEGASVGFRRRNLPALLARYFLDMRRVFGSFTELLKVGAPAYVVIGNNHTVAGGTRVEIETERLLGLIGQSVGLFLEQTIPMEMLISRDIFRKNAVASETILCFRR